MNFSKQVIERLEQLVATGPKQVEAVVLNSTQQQEYIVGVVAEEAGPSATITLDGYDRYSVMLRQLEVSLPKAGQKEPADLRNNAQSITRRLTYLEESLALVEFDLNQNIAQLRSDPPQHEGDVVTYWEGLIWTEPYPQAKLTRYRWEPGSRERKVISYPATFATLGRIVNDLALGLAGE